MHAGPVSMCCGLVSIHAHAAQVRYLYVPLGGAHRRALVVWPIFFFVAVWHDLEVRLLVGAQLVNGFMPTMPSALEQSGILHRSFTSALCHNARYTLVAVAPHELGVADLLSICAGDGCQALCTLSSL